MNVAPPRIYQLKIRLKDVRPPIWRRILVAENTPLAELHRVFQIVMGWGNSHLHAFCVGEITYTDPRAAQDSTWMKSERRVELCKISNEVKAKFNYEYDFGDGWEHDVQIEKILDAEPDTDYPVCTAGKRACPPEDCGGPGGYEYLLKNPSEWPNELFDPEAFDLTEINDTLHRI